MIYDCKKGRKYVLKLLKSSILNLSVAKNNRKTSSPAKIRYSYDSTESDIGFTGKKIESYTSTNHLSSNVALNTGMTTDDNLDGVCNNYTSENGVGQTTTFSVDGGQKITFTATTDVTSSSVYQDISCTVSYTAICEVQVKTSGNVKARVDCEWYNGGSLLSSYTSTASAYADWTTVSVSASSAPTNTTNVRIRVRIIPNAIGNVGSVWARNAYCYIGSQSAYVTTVYDQSGNNYNATQTSAVNQPLLSSYGAYQDCFVFDGLASKMQISDNSILRLNGDHTITFVSNVTSIGSSTQHLIHKGTGATGDFGFAISTGGSNARWRYRRNGANVDSNLSIVTGTWEFWAVVCSGSTQQWYRNGVKNGTAGANTYPTNTDATAIGIGSAAATSSFVAAKIKDITFYSRALSDVELVKLYNLYKILHGV